MASLLFVSADDSLIMSQISMFKAQSSASKLGSVACSVDKESDSLSDSKVQPEKVRHARGMIKIDKSN